MRAWRRAQLVFFVVLATALCTVAAYAERVQVYSMQGLDCAECANPVKSKLAKIPGVGKSDFDVQKAELTVKLADGVSDDQVLAAIQSAGFKGLVGPGKGAYLPHEKYPQGADVIVLTEKGAAVGDLRKLCAPGKYTVFDVYAAWCGPCRGVDAKLREVVKSRADVAVRKLDIVSFQTPLAHELGRKLTALPYVIVITPEGKRTDIVGLDLQKLAAALGEPR
jgi:copper chaperone CopZ